MMNSQHTTTNDGHVREHEARDLAHELVSLARAWTSYGLTVASRSVANGAEATALVAASLDRLSQSLSPAPRTRPGTVTDSADASPAPTMDVTAVE